MAEPKRLTQAGIAKLGLSPEVEQALTKIQAELGDAYRDAFVQMVGALREQAAAIQRIQATLSILVDNLVPQMRGQAPSAFTIVADGEEPDLARALVVADPIAAGFTLTQQDLADALGLPASTVSPLVRAFGFQEKEDCAVLVRAGKRNDIVNYHSKAVQTFRMMLNDLTTRKKLNKADQSAFDRARRKLGMND